MHHYFEAITNNKGDALTGYYVRLVDSGGAGVTLYADTSLTPIISVSGVADAAKVDADGNVDFYVAVGTYTLNIYATDSTTLVRSILNVGMNIDMDTAATAVAAQAAASASATAAATSETNAATSATSAAGSASAAATSASSAATSATNASTSATSSAASAALSSSSYTAIATAIAPGSLNNATVSAASRAILAGLSHSLPVLLTESGREGSFVFNSANLSTYVTADTAQGIYVAPASDTTGASGAWVRTISSGVVSPLWFGVVQGNASGANGTANDTARDAMLAVLKLRGSAAGVGTGQGVETIRFPAGYFEFATTWDLHHGSGIIEGVASGFPAGVSTTLKFATGQTGLRVHFSQSTGASDGTSGTSVMSSSGTIIRNIGIVGAYTGTEAEAYGIQLRARADIENVFINNFEGDGIYARAGVAGTGATGYRGNDNDVRIMGGRIQNCRNGIYLKGSDANACCIVGVDLSSNRQWGIYNSAFLDNYIAGCQFASNGTSAANDGVSIGASRVYYSGSINGFYGAISGQEVGASTNAPAGDGTDNAYWFFIKTASAVASGTPAWSNGMVVRAGGPIICDGANAPSLITGCYSEVDQSLAQIVAPAKVQGGSLAGQVWKGSTGQAETVATSGYSIFQRGVASKGYTGTDTAFIPLLGEAGATSKNVLSIFDSTNFAGGAAMRLQAISGDLVWQYANLGNRQALMLTMQGTAQQFGTGAAVTEAAYVPQLMLGTSATNARQVSTGTAAPSTGAHGTGEVVFNRTPSATTPFAWVCSSGGSPGTWVAVYSGYGVQLGYATGTGGAVTQATNKSTGVTLNKPTGQITMNGAALAANAVASFTFTNSQIAATDVIRVNSSGAATAGSYLVQAESAAAGSCTISVRNLTAGSLSEALVLNFVVIKGANA